MNLNFKTTQSRFFNLLNASNKASYFIAILTLALYVTKAEAQEQETRFNIPFIIDFTAPTPVLNAPGYVDANALLLIRLRNVNPYLYTINISELQRDVIYDDQPIIASPYQMSSTATMYEIEDLPYLELAEEAGSTASTKNATDALKAIQDSINLWKKGIITVEQEINKTYATLNIRVNTIRKQLNDSLVANPLNAAAFLKEIEKLENEYEYKDDSVLINNNTILSQYKIELRTLKNKIQKKEKERIALVISSGTDAEKVQLFRSRFEDYNNKIGEIRAFNTLHKELKLLLYSTKPYKDIDNERNKLLSKYIDLRDGMSIFSYCDSKTVELDEIYTTMVDLYNSLDVRSDTKNILATLKAYHHSLNRTNLSNLFLEIAKINDAISRENWYIEYLCKPVRYNTDQVVYNISISSRPSEYSMVNKNQNYEYRLNVKNGLRLNVSAALLFNYQLQDDVPVVSAIDDNTTIITRGNENNLLVPTYGVLLNAYKRSPRDINLVANLGTATNGSNLFYYLGGGLILGKEERIGLSFGLVGSQIQQLNSAYEFDIAYNQPIASLADKQLLYPEKQFRTGYYFGFTYNLKGRNNQQFSLGPKKSS